MFDVVIIGCGIVGAATAYELSRYRLTVAVLEKENDVADGTTKANSAILHAGYDPIPGTRMARLNVEGSRLARNLCEELQVPYQPCGSLVVALDEEQMGTLRELYRRGEENGVPGLQLLDGRAAKALEPGLSPEVQGALLAETAAIVNPWEYCLALAETAVKNGAELYLDREVTGIEAIPGGYRTTASGQSYEARYVVNAAGVNADRVHNMIAPPAFRIRPRKGEYYLLDKSEGKRVSHVVFPCPSREGKGVLVAPTVHGNLIVGPNNQPVEDGGDTATTREGLREVGEKAGRTVRGIDLRACIRTFAGVRAAGCLLEECPGPEDFILAPAEGAPGFIDLAGIQSPGLTAAPAIAKEAVKLLQGEGLALVPKESFVSGRRRTVFKELPAEEKAALAAENPAYGRVICRCETITEGEILDCFRSPIPPRTVDGIKRRCGAGMGRCQGGFCGPRVVELLARELGCSPLEILQDKEGSVILTNETKGGRRGEEGL